MSYLLKAVVLFSSVLSVYPVAIEDCKCWKEYEAKEYFEGFVMCYSVGLLTVIPCNLPDPPKCVCTEDKVTAILKDPQGTWCTKNELGRKIKRWECENKKEWAAYKVKYAEYEKNRQ